MATYQVVKGSVSLANLWLYRFTNALVDCVSFASAEIAIGISRQPDAAFGTDLRVQRSSGTSASIAAANFSHSVVAPHANSYARHFAAVNGRTARMDLGNLVEQVAIKRLREAYPRWIETTHYRYQVSRPVGHLFPINYLGTTKSARPDIRYEFYSGTPKGDEVVFDITTPGEAGHLLGKRVDARTIKMHPRIPIAVEIIWEDCDIYYP